MKHLTFWFDVIPPYAYPTFERLPEALDGLLFGGVDSLDMLVACLQGDPWFDGPGWQAPHTAIAGLVRRPAVQW